VRGGSVETSKGEVGERKEAKGNCKQSRKRRHKVAKMN